ncbi:Phycocyanobilin:ferredoxin oxidoreductase [Labeo rohita]|uniref:Phycocyanobilin:ferredoxin oxidoreductase n=1 Tax=Labeo rohita TaxID=84645 RepID=A0ABQ8LWV0_LABRO|nr:Phycocyanobilin:ferredoxin oxidoreductase [Labeo rohita]
MLESECYGHRNTLWPHPPLSDLCYMVFKRVWDLRGSQWIFSSSICFFLYEPDCSLLLWFMLLESLLSAFTLEPCNAFCWPVRKLNFIFYFFIFFSFCFDFEYDVLNVLLFSSWVNEFSGDVLKLEFFF